LRAILVQFRHHDAQATQRNRQLARPPAQLIRQLLLLEQALHIRDLGHTRHWIGHRLEVNRVLAVAEDRLADAVREVLVLGLAVQVPRVLRLRRRRHIGRRLAVKELDVLLPIGVVEGHGVAERCVLTRHAGIVLDGEVVHVEVVEIEGAAERVGRGEEPGSTDGDGEVGTHIQAFGKAFEQMWNGHVAAIMVEEVVVCEG
jgi:hypothetical protein